MSIEVVPTFTDPFYTMTTTLDGRDYSFAFRYNQREDAWYFDLGLPTGTLLVRGVKVVCGVSLLKRFADSRIPPGALVALSNTSDNASRETPGLLELGEGKRVTLVYFSKSEFT